MRDQGRPAVEETNDYFRAYVEAARGERTITGLEVQGERVRRGLETIDGEAASHRYREGAWSIAQIIAHLVDVERLFQGWALRIARGDTGPFPTFDPDDWVREGRHEERAWSDLREDFALTRAATIRLHRSLPDEAADRKGRMGASHEFTVRAIAFIVQGHVDHHLSVLGDRYGVAAFATD